MPANPSPQRTPPGYRVVLSPNYNRRCSCGAVLDYETRYDSEFCPVCDRWRAKRCDDPFCEFCPQRPARPSLAPPEPVPEPVPRGPFNPPRIKPAKRGQGSASGSGHRK